MRCSVNSNVDGQTLYVRYIDIMDLKYTDLPEKTAFRISSQFIISYIHSIHSLSRFDHKSFLCIFTLS